MDCFQSFIKTFAQNFVSCKLALFLLIFCALKPMNVVNCNIWFILEFYICKTNLKVLKHISHNTTSGIKVKMIPGTMKHGCDSTVA